MDASTDRSIGGAFESASHCILIGFVFYRIAHHPWRGGRPRGLPGRGFAVGIPIGIKRLHDRNKCGRWLFLFYLVPGLLNSLVERLVHGSCEWTSSG